jgi:hypothetical protein
MTLSDLSRAYEFLALIVGPGLLVGIALRGIRMSSYWWSFLQLCNRYRERRGVGTEQLRLHYVTMCRREDWNFVPGKTFIVHYDDKSVMTPAELRKPVLVLAGTQKKILEGPIYYPLEYTDAALICRSMEANRPVGCFEGRRVMGGFAQ